MAFADDAVWQSEDWKWDAYKLTAAPADARATKEGGKSGHARAAADGKQGCQVDGCNIELGGQKDYHSRYKICEVHLKAPVVVHDGRAHRFCQQCGKFQALNDFDGDKRSCRARLEKHNARRRRQREMAHMLKKTGTVDEKMLAEKYGLKQEELAPKVARMAKAGYSVKPSTSDGSPTMTAGTGRGSKSPSPTASQPTEGHGGGMSLFGTAAAAQAAAAVQQAQQAAETDAANQAALASLMHEMQAHQVAMEKAATAMAAQHAQQQQHAYGAPAHLLGGGPAPNYPQMVASLSSSENQMAAAANSLSLLLDDQFLDDVFNPMMTDPAVVGPSNLAGGAAAAAAAAFLQMDAASAMDLDDMAGLEVLTDQLMGCPPAARMLGGAHATWPHPPAFPPTPSSSNTALPAPPPYLTQPHLHAPPSLASNAFPRALLGGTPFGASLQPPPPLPGSHNMRLGAGGRAESPASGRSTATALSMPRGISGGCLDEALNLLSYDSAQVTYVPEEKLVRFSAKLFNCTPAQLPSDLKASLVNMLSCQSMEGYLRPGCVHITVNALMGPEERALLATSGVRAVVERLVERQPEAFWGQHAMLIQLGDKLALVRDGRVVHVLATANSSLFPRVAALRPLAAEPAREGSSVEVSVWGYNLDNEADTILARSNGTYAEVERVRLEADPSWNGMHRLDLRLTGLTGPGAVQVEVMRGGYISGSKSMLLTPDRSLVSEVRTLEAEQSETDIDSLLFQLASCEAWAAGAGVRDFSTDDRQVLAKSARRLLPYAVQRKWVSATRSLLAAVAADSSAEDAMSAVDVICVGTTSMPLLQLAVRSQISELVRVVLAWGEANDYVFKATTPGHRGLTALHLAGLVNDGGIIAALLSEKCSDALEGWERAGAEDGTLPLDFAHRTGNSAVVERLIAMYRYEAAKSAVPEKMAAAGIELAPCYGAGTCTDGACALALSSGALALASDMGDVVGLEAAKASTLVQRRGAKTAWDSASSSRTYKELAEGVPADSVADAGEDIAAQKAAVRARRAVEHAQGSLLRFCNPELEGKYTAWYNSGQVPVDIAFLVIAILSQGAWIFRWSRDASWVGAAMIALMAMNAALMQASATILMAVLFPSVYAKWREPLCVWSHVIHKLAQLAVTLVPPVGTIFSASYNPTVALLESSSLAQVHMLSFGLKLRFGAHPGVGLFHFATALAANDQICAAGFPFLPGGACNALLCVWQAITCFALPCALVYASEKRSRRIFLDTVSD